MICYILVVCIVCPLHFYHIVKSTYHIVKVLCGLHFESVLALISSKVCGLNICVTEFTVLKVVCVKSM